MIIVFLEIKCLLWFVILKGYFMVGFFFCECDLKIEFFVNLLLIFWGWVIKVLLGYKYFILKNVFLLI